MAILGAGDLFAIKVIGVDMSFVNVGTIKSIDGPNITVGEVDATILSSTFKPYLPTLPEGEGTFNIQHMNTDTVCTKLQSLTTVPVPTVTAKITWNDGYATTFNFFSKGYSISGVENEDIVMAAIPFRMLTAPVTASGS